MPQNRFQKIDVNLPLRAQSFNGRKSLSKDAENRNRFRSFFSLMIFFQVVFYKLTFRIATNHPSIMGWVRRIRWLGKASVCPCL